MRFFHNGVLHLILCLFWPRFSPYSDKSVHMSETYFFLYMKNPLQTSSKKCLWVEGCINIIGQSRATCTYIKKIFVRTKYSITLAQLCSFLTHRVHLGKGCTETFHIVTIITAPLSYLTRT